MAHLDYPQYQHPALAAFAPLASEFCDLVERRAILGRDAFLQAVHRQIPRLYSAALSLPSTDVLYDLTTEDDEGADEPTVDTRRDVDRRSHEEWSSLFQDLATFIGPANSYREVFDPYESTDQAEVTGNLADDFADIYADLQLGLRKWVRGESGEALWAWRFSFEAHWGEHASGALRALYARCSLYDSSWPTGSSNAA